jgi:hypothetical protein
MKCLLCFLDRVRVRTPRPQSKNYAPPASPEPRPNRVFSDRDRNRRSLSLPTASSPDPQQPTIFGPGESPSTPSLSNADSSLQSKPSPESPEAVADQIVTLVWKLQRRVIRYVEGLSLQSNEGSLARSRIYDTVISLAQSATRNPEECEFRLWQARRSQALISTQTRRWRDHYKTNSSSPYPHCRERIQT